MIFSCVGLTLFFALSKTGSGQAVLAKNKIFSQNIKQQRAFFAIGCTFAPKLTKIMSCTAVDSMPARTKTVTSELLFLQIRLHRFAPGGALFPTSCPADGKPLFAIRRDIIKRKMGGKITPPQNRCDTDAKL